MGFSKQEYWSGVPLPSPTGHAIIFFIIFATLFVLVCLFSLFIFLLLFFTEPQALGGRTVQSGLARGQRGTSARPRVPSVLVWVQNPAAAGRSHVQGRRRTVPVGGLALLARVLSSPHPELCLLRPRSPGEGLLWKRAFFKEPHMGLQRSVWPLRDGPRVNAVWSGVDLGRGPPAARRLLPRDGEGSSRQKLLQGQPGASGTIELCPEQKLRTAVGDQGLRQARGQNSDHEESTILRFHRNVMRLLWTHVRYSNSSRSRRSWKKSGRRW